MEDWGLLAVVRGGSCNNIVNFGESPSMDPQATSFFVNNPLSIQQNDTDDLALFNSFPHLFETTTVLDELEELYKPFYPFNLEYPAPNSHDLSSAPTVQVQLNQEPEKEHIMIKKAKAPVAPKYKKR